MKNLRIGVIGSSGGGALRAVLSILAKTQISHEFFIVTDRPCGMNDIPHQFSSASCEKFEGLTNELFSAKCREYFESQGSVDFILLFFSRIVTDQIFERWVTVNLHESILPAFHGFSALQKAIESRVRFFGATMHLVDESVDQGRILAQAVCPLLPGKGLEELLKTTYLQKVYLVLLLIESWIAQGGMFHSGESVARWFDSRELYSAGFNPALSNEQLLRLYRKWVEENEGDLLTSLI